MKILNDGISLLPTRNGNSLMRINQQGANVDIPLPIILEDFYGYVNNNKEVVLNWSTFSETNNDYYTLEKSIDGNNYNYIGKVSGSGNSNIIRTYKFIDSENNSSYYYRLKQTDYDGKSSYCKIIYINKYKNKDFHIINNKLEFNTITNVEIYDIYGNRLYIETNNIINYLLETNNFYIIKIDNTIVKKIFY